MFSRSIEADSIAVIREGLLSGWVGTQPSRSPISAGQDWIKRRRGKQTKTHRSTASNYWPSVEGKISEIQPPSVVQFSAEPRVQAWLKFTGLVAQWHTERGATSSITAMAMCDAYQKIIGMGPDAISLIIAQMRSEADEPDQWFWALQVLTGVDPVAPEDRGDYAKMAQSWIDWAATEGYGW